MTSSTIATRRRIAAPVLAAAFTLALALGATAAHADTTPSAGQGDATPACCGYPPG